MIKLDYPYFDNNATTPIHPAVQKILQEYQMYYYANPSSQSHPLGMVANSLFHLHQNRIAELLNISSDDIIFTSGATEAINTAIKSIFFQYSSQKNHIISCTTEHSAVLETLNYLKNYHHAQLTYLDVNTDGAIDLVQLKKSINSQTLMVCLMTANNETGIIHPVEEIYDICKEKKVLFFSDTTQAFGKMKFQNIQADIFCGSAHKFYGPKGIGFLVIKNLGRKIFLHPFIHGGYQQKYRSGTLPLPLIAAMSKSLEILFSDYEHIMHHTQIIRDTFEDKIKNVLKVKVHGSNTKRLSNTSNIMVSDEHYEKFLKAMKHFCFSKASACSDYNGKSSHVLKAMNCTDEEIKNSFRFSFGQMNTMDEINDFVNYIIH